MSTVRIQVRRGTASQWTSVNPILAAGEMGVESDTNLFKFGNGSSIWTALAYANNSDVAIAEISQDAIDRALSMGAGLSKTYNDGANTITIAVDPNVIALKSYVDAQVSGLANTVDTDYIPLSDRGVAGGVASLNSSGLVPDDQINGEVFATKTDLHAAVNGIQIKASVQASSVENFDSVRTAGSEDQSGGTGVGEYLTASNNAALVIDGYTVLSGDRVLLKNQTDAKQNGVYSVTSAGSSSSKAVLTRSTDADNSVNGEVREGLFVFTQNGTLNHRDGYALLAEASRAGEVFQLGTDGLTFSQFTGALPVLIGTGLEKNGDLIAVDFASVATKASIDALVALDIPALKTTVGTHTLDISQINQKNNYQDVSISELELDVATNVTDIAANAASIATNTANIATNTAGIATHTTQITAINATNTSQDSQITGLGTRLTAAENTVSSNSASIIAAEAQATELNTTLRTDLAPKNDATFTGTTVLPATTSIGTVASTEIAYLNGVTSGIQSQIDSKLATSSAESTYETISKVALKAPLANPTFTGTVSGVTKAHVGLGNVDDTADSAKPVSTAQAAAIATAKSEALAEVTAVIAGAPNALNTLDELAAALNDDANFASTITTSIGSKVASYTPVTNRTANFGINDADYHDGWLDVDSTGDVVVTVPADGTNSRTYPVGTSLDIFRANTGNVTIAGSGATVNGTPGLKLRARYSSATLFKRAANTWVLIGDLTA